MKRFCDRTGLMQEPVAAFLLWCPLDQARSDQPPAGPRAMIESGVKNWMRGNEMTVEWQVRGPEYEEDSNGLRNGDCVVVETPVGIPCIKFVFDDPYTAQLHMEALERVIKAAVSIEIIAT